MIERPKRAVTRFFIPLIDVLILLFCIFLLMPFMSQPGNAESSEAKKAADLPEEMRNQIAGLRIDLERAKRDVKRMQDERINPTERLSVCVLEIDPKNGLLFFYRDGERKPVKDQRTAQEEVIDEHKRRTVGKEPFFLILMPNEFTGIPTQPQLDEYEKWFKQAPHRFNNPLGPATP